MSVPARSGTKMSARALVRLKWGSTWITVAPRAFASITHWKADRVGLGHVRALDHDAVGVLQVPREGRGAAATEGGAEPDHRRAVTDPRLVLHLDHPERRPELLDQVVLLVVEGRAAEARDAEAAPHALALALPLPGLAPGLR